MINGAEKMLVENNIIDVGIAQPIQIKKFAAATFFNNQTSAGQLIRRCDSANQSYQSELATRIEDALVLSL